MSSDDALGDFRMGEGGLLRRFEAAAHLTSLRRQILSILCFTWLPLVLFGGLNAYLRGYVGPLIRDPSTHVRLLVATPVFLFIDGVFPLVCKETLVQLQTQGFIPKAARPRFERILRVASHLANSLWAEVLIAAAGLGLGIAALTGLLPVRTLRHEDGLTAAQVWYALTDLPLFQFLLWRSLWRWTIWVQILVRLSRIELDLVPSHPDRRGGIKFLRKPSIAYCALLLLAVSSVLCAQWSGRFAIDATLATFKPLLLIFGGGGALIALGPLLLFTRMLFRARRAGMAEFDGLAAKYGRHFRQHWLRPEQQPARLCGGDLQPLTDLSSNYRETVERLNVILFEGRDLIVLLVATLVPVLPLMVMSIPHEDWRELLGLLAGGRLG